MEDVDALYARIMATPDDDTLRLVYADALDERGRKEDHWRAEFIRAQIGGDHERAKVILLERGVFWLSGTDPKWWLFRLDGPDHSPNGDWFVRGFIGRVRYSFYDFPYAYEPVRLKFPIQEVELYGPRTAGNIQNACQLLDARVSVLSIPCYPHDVFRVQEVQWLRTATMHRDSTLKEIRINHFTPGVVSLALQLFLNQRVVLGRVNYAPTKGGKLFPYDRDSFTVVDEVEHGTASQIS